MPTGTKRQVINGTVTKTSGGLCKKDIKTVKRSGNVRYISKRKSQVAKNNFSGWQKAVKQAKKELGIPQDEFVLVKKGSKLYKAAAKIYYV
jgi:hypothetical protein